MRVAALASAPAWAASHHARALEGVAKCQFALHGSSFQRPTAPSLALPKRATPSSSLACQGLADAGEGAKSEAALQSSVRRAAVDSALSTLARFEEALGTADKALPARSEHPAALSHLRNQAQEPSLRNQASFEAEERLLEILWVIPKPSNLNPQP